MPVTIQLQDEEGNAIEVLEEGGDRLVQAIRILSEQPYLLLHGLDPWGDTTFNGLQSRKLVDELSTLLDQELAPETRKVVLEVRRLATIARDDVHTYLKFIGD